MRKFLLFSAVLLLVMPIFEASASHGVHSSSEESRWFSIENLEIDIPSELPDEFAVRLSTPSQYIKFKHGG